MRTFLLAILILFGSNVGFGQKELVDLPIAPASAGFDIIPLDTAGFYAIERVGLVKSRALIKKGFHFDKDLVLKDTFAIEMDERFSLARWTSNATGAYFLYKKTRLKNELGLMHVSPKGLVNFSSVELENDLIIQHFQPVGKNALVGGLFRFTPAFFIYGTEENMLITLPGFNVKGVNLIQSTVDETNEIITIVTSALFGETNQLTYNIKNFNFQGDLLRDVYLNPDKNKNLLSVSVSNFLYDSQFIFGAYGDAKSQGASGVYSIELLPSGSQRQNFTPFFEIENIYNHMNAKKANRIVSKAKKYYAKKGRWSTSERPQLYTPVLGDGFVHYALEMDMDSKENLFQIVINKDNKIVNTSNTAINQNSVNRYTNRNPNDFVMKSNAYRILKSGVCWEYNNQFYYAYRNGDSIEAKIIDENNAQLVKKAIPKVEGVKVFRNLEEKIFPWYGNKVLVATLESRRNEDRDAPRHMIVTPVTLY